MSQPTPFNENLVPVVGQQLATLTLEDAPAAVSPAHLEQVANLEHAANPDEGSADADSQVLEAEDLGLARRFRALVSVKSSPGRPRPSLVLNPGEKVALLQHNVRESSGFETRTTYWVEKNPDGTTREYIEEASGLPSLLPVASRATTPMKRRARDVEDHQQHSTTGSPTKKAKGKHVAALGEH
ncbi:hypothetical protein JCM3775_007388 [Rhodotorula graminis]